MGVDPKLPVDEFSASLTGSRHWSVHSWPLRFKASLFVISSAVSWSQWFGYPRASCVYEL